VDNLDRALEHSQADPDAVIEGVRAWGSGAARPGRSRLPSPR
jgi:hypothetical protein